MILPLRLFGCAMAREGLLLSKAVWLHSSKYVKKAKIFRLNGSKSLDEKAKGPLGFLFIVPVAQWIERLPPEQQAARSIRAGDE